MVSRQLVHLNSRLYAPVVSKVNRSLQDHSQDLLRSLTLCRGVIWLEIDTCIPIIICAIDAVLTEALGTWNSTDKAHMRDIVY